MLMADQVCSSPSPRGRITSQPSTRLGEVQSGWDGETVAHLLSPRNWGPIDGGRRPRHGWGRVSSRSVCEGVGRERGRHRGLSWRPHKNPQDAENFPQSHRHANPRQAAAALVRGEGTVLTLGYRTGLNFSPTASSQNAWAEREKRTAQVPRPRSAPGLPCPPRERAWGHNLQGPGVWGQMLGTAGHSCVVRKV